jgi:predicted kinase
MKIVYIMRGIAGSGKSTKARELAGDIGAVHSTDDYMMVDGKYSFDARRLSEVHEKNLDAFCKSLEEGVSIVVCDNTNIRRAWFEEYVWAAEVAGYEVKIITMPHPDVALAAERNIHGCPARTIQRMIDRFED